MGLFFMALGHLLWKTLLGVVGGWMSTSLLAIVVGAINYFLAPYVDAHLHGEQVTKKPRLTGSIVVAVGTWILLFGLSMISTLYHDHQYWVRQSQILTAEIVPKDQKISDLTQQLTDSCYNPDRHFTPEQKNTLYLSLRDLAERTSTNNKRIFIGSVKGDREASWYIQFFIYPLFKSAGWNIASTFQRPMVGGDVDLPYPGFQQGGLSVTPIEDVGTKGYEEKQDVLAGIFAAFQEAKVPISNGTVDPHDPLKRETGLVIWVGPKVVKPESE